MKLPIKWCRDKRLLGSLLHTPPAQAKSTTTSSATRVRQVPAGGSIGCYRCRRTRIGARNVDNILTNTLLPDISKQLLSRIAEGQKPESVRITIGENSQFVIGSAEPVATAAPA